MMSNQCKWISFFVLSLAVILLLLLFYSIGNQYKCPNDGELWYEETSQCYMKNTQGPCSQNLTFAEYEHRSPLGYCGCPYMKNNRLMVYHKEGDSEQCHYIFTQAYCKEDEFVTVTKLGVPYCTKNYCLQYYSNDPDNLRGNVEWVPIKGGGCAELGHTMEGCPEGAVVRFHQNYVHPSCQEPPKNKFGQSLGAIGVGSYSNCPVGSYRSIVGKCQATFDFDFDSDGSTIEESSELPKN